VCGGQGFLLEGSEEACMCLSPLENMEGSWPGLEGGQVAVLRLHVMARSQIATVSWSRISPLRDCEHEGNEGRIVH